MSKLHYVHNTGSVVITEHTAEKFSEVNEDQIIRSVEFIIKDVPKKLIDGEAVKSLASYGLQKLLQDRTSSTKDASDKLSEMETLFNEHLMQGNWKSPAKVGASGPRGRKISATLAQAVGELLNMDALTAEANLKALDKDRFEAITKSEKVLSKVKELEASVVVDDGALADLLG